MGSLVNPTSGALHRDLIERVYIPQTPLILKSTWVVVTTTVPFWVHSIVRHPIFRVPKKGP